MTWDACTMEPNTWLRWIECHHGAVSTFQVIATVAVAIVGWRISINMRKRDEAYQRLTYRRQLLALLRSLQRLAHSMPETLHGCLSDKRLGRILIPSTRSRLAALVAALQHRASDELLGPEAQEALPGWRAHIGEICRALLINLDKAELDNATFSAIVDLSGQLDIGVKLVAMLVSHQSAIERICEGVVEATLNFKARLRAERIGIARIGRRAQRWFDQRRERRDAARARAASPTKV